MRDIRTNKKHTAEERVNSISCLQIQFDKLKKKTGLLSGAISLQVAVEAPPAARLVQPKILADKVIGLEIELQEEEQKEQYEDILKEQDKSVQASALSFQMVSVIRWNVQLLFQPKAHKLHKKIKEHANILTRIENGEAVIYWNAVPNSNLNRYLNQ